MFQRLIKNFIEFQKRVLYKLETAYEETYAETSKELNKTIEQIKERNKRKFISKAEHWIAKDFKDVTGETMSKTLRRYVATQLFEAALKKGDLDDLYNLKEERFK